FRPTEVCNECGMGPGNASAVCCCSQRGWLGIGLWTPNRHFSQELACSDVARALVPAEVPSGPGALADASFETVSQPRTRVEMSLDTAGRVPSPPRLAECEKVGISQWCAMPVQSRRLISIPAVPSFVYPLSFEPLAN